VIELPEGARKDETLVVNVSVGKEIAHPNTTEHHIEWIEVYFLPDGEKFPHLVGRFDFSAHGASADGPNTSSVYTQPSVACSLQTGKPGNVYAKSYCNIHGLWVNSAVLKLG
jgi:superoxide reductase